MDAAAVAPTPVNKGGASAQDNSPVGAAVHACPPHPLQGCDADTTRQRLLLSRFYSQLLKDNNIEAKLKLLHEGASFQVMFTHTHPPGTPYSSKEEIWRARHEVGAIDHARWEGRLSYKKDQYEDFRARIDWYNREESRIEFEENLDWWLTGVRSAFEWMQSAFCQAEAPLQLPGSAVAGKAATIKSPPSAAGRVSGKSFPGEDADPVTPAAGTLSADDERQWQSQQWLCAELKKRRGFSQP